MSKDNAKKGKREEQIRKLREKREICFAVLFEMTFSDETVEQILEKAYQVKLLDKLYSDDKDLADEEEIIPETDEFIIDILESYSDHKDEIDDEIKSHIKGWTIERLSRVTLSVLRFAITELKYGTTSEKIVINEAVELSKKYSTPQDARFVNGVLGSVVRKTEE